MFDAVDIISSNTDTALRVSTGYNELWDSIYANQNGLWNISMYLSELVLSWTFINGSLELVKSIVSNKVFLTLDQCFWFLIVGLLLSNNGYYLAHLTIGINDFSVETTRMIYAINIKNVSLGNAVKDIIITKELETELEKSFATCEIKTGVEQVKCLEKTARESQQKINQIELEGKKLKIDLFGLSALNKKVENLSEKEIALRPGILTGAIAKGIIYGILKAIQWVYSQSVELGQILTGLYGPVAVALSLYRLPFRPLQSWLLGFISIAIINWSYAAVVGLISWVMVIQGLQTYSDLGFLLFLCVGAPTLSIYTAQKGGVAIYENFVEISGLGLKVLSMGSKLLF